MKKIVFICAGIICRSAMAEFMFKDIIKKRGLENKYSCESRAVRFNNYGKDMYYLSKECLDRHQVPYTLHNSRMVKPEEYNDVDIYFIMAEDNRDYFNRIIEDKENKVRMLLNEVIVDPWPDGDFEKVYEQINRGINEFLEVDNA